LERIEQLLERLGHPERALPPVVHVAGTNGKGSVIAYLRAMLEAEGKRVHVYTSPHLVRFAERIRVAGRLIEEGALSSLLEECEAANGLEPITFFEITTAAAFLAFARTPADALLLEVGLGGRLDATNVIERPALSVITPISLDHRQYLGERLEEMAFEKAGVLKPGVGCVLGPQESRVFAVIEERARALGVSLIAWSRDYDAQASAGGLAFRDGAEHSLLPLPALAGAHQLINAATAVAAARRLGALRPSPRAIEEGLRSARWPARLQPIERGPLRAALPPGAELWLDGGHNGGAGAALAQSLRLFPRMPLDLVVGMINSKAPAEFVGPLAPYARSVSCVPVPGEPAGFSPDELADHLAHMDKPIRTAPDVFAALRGLAEATRRLRVAPGRVLICGSLYLAGSVLAESGLLPD